MTCHTTISKVMRQVVQWCGKPAPPPPPYPPKVVVQHRTATPPRPAWRPAGWCAVPREFAKHESESAGRGSTRASTPARREATPFPQKDTTMSKGIGHLQRGILAALAARPGGDMVRDGCGRRAWLGVGVHDLRAISREMTRAAGTPDCEYATSVWTAGFSRAVAGLAQRHMIDVLWRVPLIAIEPEFQWPSAEFAGDIHLNWYSRQRRFVRA